jgi:hypothetical protein
MNHKDYSDFVSRILRHKRLASAALLARLLQETVIYSSLFSQAIVWSKCELVNPSGFDGARRQPGHAHGSGYNITALSALLYVRIDEGKGSCREHSPASAHSAQYGSIGHLVRGSERAVAGHVCPTAHQGQGLEHLARTNTGLLIKSTIMFPTKIVRKKRCREERLAAVVDGTRSFFSTRTLRGPAVAELGML